MGGEVAIVEGMDRLLAREPAPLGDALAEALRADGVELHLGVHAAAASPRRRRLRARARRRPVLRGDRLLVATGRRPRVEGLGLETVGIEAGRARHRGRRAHERGRRPVGDRRRHRHLAADLRRQVPGPRRGGEHPRRARARPTTPRFRASCSPTRRRRGRRGGRAASRATVPLAEVAAHRHLHARVRPKPGFMTLVSDGERLTGAYAVGPEAGEWLQQATLAIRARVPLAVLRDVDPAVPHVLRGVPPRAARARGARPRADRLTVGRCNARRRPMTVASNGARARNSAVFRDAAGPRSGRPAARHAPAGDEEAFAFEERATLKTWLFHILANKAKTRGVRERVSACAWRSRALPTTQQAVLTLRDVEGLEADDRRGGSSLPARAVRERGPAGAPASPGPAPRAAGRRPRSGSGRTLGHVGPARRTAIEVGLEARRLARVERAVEVGGDALHEVGVGELSG